MDEQEREATDRGRWVVRFALCMTRLRKSNVARLDEGRSAYDTLRHLTPEAAAERLFQDHPGNGHAR